MTGWMKAICAGFALLASAAMAEAQNFAGLGLGDDTGAIAQRLGPASSSEAMPGGMTARLWHLPQGHELSITTGADGGIVYLESWLLPGTPPPLPGQGVALGQTTAADIIGIAGSLGLSFANRGYHQEIAGNDIWFLSYEMQGAPDEIITFVFLSPLSARQYDPNGALIVTPSARLDSLIMARESYITGPFSDWGARLPAPVGYAPLPVSRS